MEAVSHPDAPPPQAAPWPATAGGWPDLRRLVRIAAVLARHGVTRLAAPLARRFPALGRRFPRAALSPPERFRGLLEELGGTFIKLGQMLALQPDILSLAHCNALFKLLDQVEPFPYADVERTFLEDLGRRPEELYHRFEAAPLAAASIGQVHAAELDGRKLAVKVRRPTVETDFAGDIRLMEMAVAAIRRLRLKPLYWLVEPLSEFVAWTREELDYRFEARYMDQLGANARHNSAEKVPTVDWRLTTSRILTQEYLDGVTVLDHLRAVEAGDQVTAKRLAAAGFEPRAFARNLIDNFLGDAFRYGLFHADLHPANLMILPGNVVGYLDFGITGVLSPHSRRHLIAMTLAYTRGDLEGMQKAFFKVSSFEADADRQAFRRGLGELARSWYEGEGEGRRLKKNFTLVMLDMLRLSRASGVWPERDVIKYIRSSIAIDGLITRFAPGFEVGRYLAEVCDRQLRLHRSQAALDPRHLMAGSLAAAGLLQGGAPRASALLDRLLEGELPLRAQLAVADRSASPRPLPTFRQWALVGAFGLTALLSADQGLGVNPFTASLLLTGAALAGLASGFRRSQSPSLAKGDLHA